jgi:cation diffusion facilitator family transporter
MNSGYSHPNTENSARVGIKTTILGILCNTFLAIIKAAAGVFGHSQALIADAIESTTDILTSLVVIFGLRMARKPADRNHPYGHGKFEPLASVIVAISLFLAAAFIMLEAYSAIGSDNITPHPSTLIVLVVVILVKELLYKYVVNVGKNLNSSSVKSDAHHHRSDAITSAAAFLGISIALIGGPGFESADDIAAIFAALIIIFNAIIIFRPALLELIDTAPSQELLAEVRQIAETVPGVLGTHKCQVRKLGFDYFVDLDVLCNPELTIREGHDIAHKVGAALHQQLPQITKVLVHVEPIDDYGKRSLS